ncbi:MAG: helix-turn-helix transcriptional regulator [Eubacteriales bacterium]|nr:helix-turn-helix transcriptional regulator [Eubacteriales bacterium]
MDKKVKVVGKNLKKHRKEKNLTQERLASRAGYHRTYISALERGRVNPTLCTLTNLSDKLGISIQELFDDTKRKG